MKRTFILILIVVAALVGMYFLPQICIGGIELRGVDLLSDVRVAEKDSTATMTDTIPAAEEVKGDSVPEGMIPIEDFRDSLNRDREMDRFYNALRDAGKRVVRIAYFGDSFIEGDILTANLRQLLQEEYGGRGVGFVDIHSQIAGFRTTVLEHSTGWQDYSINEHGKGFDPRLQGIGSRYFTTGGNAVISLQGQHRVFPERLDTVNCAIVYYTPGTDMTMTAMVNGQEAMMSCSPMLCEATADTLDSIGAATPEYADIRKAVITGKIGKLRVDVSGSGRFYGVAMEGRNGIVVDNFSMRSSNGWHLSTIPDETLRAFARLRHYDLIVMHYGLNAPIASKDYSAYCNKFREGIRKFRKAFPQTSILITSVSNRDRRGANGQFETMNGIEQLVSAQRQMAKDEHIAFWNLQQAMGGSGSTYRMQQAGQANRDYTHINFKGGEVLGQLMFDVLQNGKMNYERRKVKAVRHKTNNE